MIFCISDCEFSSGYGINSISFCFCSLPVEQQSRGKKRPNPSSALALVEPKTVVATIDRSSASKVSAGTSPSGLCRPWDRGDLMRRLATFKSMTWFAKPQVCSL